MQTGTPHHDCSTPSVTAVLSCVLRPNHHVLLTAEVTKYADTDLRQRHGSHQPG